MLMNSKSLQRALLVSLCLCAPVALTACGSTPIVGETAGDISGSGALLTVEGLGCPMCAESIHVLLNEVDGVADSSVDLSRGIVDVEFEPGASVPRAALAAAVVDGGFSLRSIEAKD